MNFFYHKTITFAINCFRKPKSHNLVSLFTITQIHKHDASNRYTMSRMPPSMLLKSLKQTRFGKQETVMVATRSWWRMLVGGEDWWWCSGAPEFFCGRGSGEIPVDMSDPDAVPLLSGTIPRWRASWEASVYFTLSRGKP
jgi:hypothetical protein